MDNSPAVDAKALFASDTKVNILPFAVMAGGWLAPLLKFWALASGFHRPYDFPDGDYAPPLALFAGAVLVSYACWWLPAGWYRPRRFERRLWPLFGVRLFRYLVPDGDLANRWRRRREPGFRVVRNRAAAEVFLRRTVRSEQSHLMLLVFGAFSAVWAWHLGWNGWALFLTVGNVLVNLYPILLQRYTRSRFPARFTG
ncbi:MAG TPA: hypothetical protein VF618_28850 [Thermoanaerobaculia bacterium]